MCTLSIISITTADGTGGLRVACNRDESRLRPIAGPPEERNCGSRRGIFPIDPVSDGTWIGANDAGLVLILMNVYHRDPDGTLTTIVAADGERISRGRIIPQALAATNLEGAIEGVEDLELGRFDPFRLVMTDGLAVVEILWSRMNLHVGEATPIVEPLFYTSSGLGNEIVDPRHRLFDELFTNSSNLVAAQDAFHRHAWPDNPRASVWMTRPEAMTVSRTVVAWDPAKVGMSYSARRGEGHEELPVVTRELSRLKES